jgi:hypothetical protein
MTIHSFVLSCRFHFEDKNANLVNLVDPSKSTAAFELGSSHIYAPKSVVDEVVKRAKARQQAGIYVVKCKDFEWLYDFVFFVDNMEIKIPARHFVVDVSALGAYRKIVNCRSASETKNAI